MPERRRIEGFGGCRTGTQGHERALRVPGVIPEPASKNGGGGQAVHEWTVTRRWGRRQTSGVRSEAGEWQRADGLGQALSQLGGGQPCNDEDLDGVDPGGPGCAGGAGAERSPAEQGLSWRPSFPNTDVILEWLSFMVLLVFRDAGIPCIPL